MPLDLPCGVAVPDGFHAYMGTEGLVRALMRARPTWRLGAKGPNEFDCWSMVQAVQYCLFGRILTPVDLGPGARLSDIRRAVGDHEANAQWAEREGQTEHGDAVTMAHGEVPWHVGTFLQVDRGVIVHISETTGLCVDGRAELHAKGYRSLRFHRFVGGGA